LVRQRLGGNCYENSELLYYALTFFGFETYRIPAWATNGARYNRTIPSAHNITLVRFNGDLYLLDSAFSYNSLRFPVKLGFDKTEE
jgi:arylamine N-acetyltransferase